MLNLGVVASQLKPWDDGSLILRLDANRLDSYPGSGTTWFDISGQGRNATLNNVPLATLGSTKCMAFNGSGTNSYAYIPHDAAFDLQGPSTVSLWFRATDNREGAFVEKGYYAGNGGWMHWWVTNEMRYYIRKASRLANGGFGVNTWYHVATTIDGSQIRMTANGGSFLTSAYAGYSEPNTQPLIIGQYAGIQYYYGYMNGIRIHNRALELAEIQAMFNDERALYGV
jgi:hypothetical protein